MVVATVQNITGNVWARAEDGSLRLLQNGDELLAGEIIITGENATVELVYDNNVLLLTANQTLELGESMDASEPVQIEDVTVDETTVASILDLLEGDGDLLEELDAAAAGLDGGAGSEGSSNFIQLVRLSESLDPVQFNSDPNAQNFGEGADLDDAGVLPDGEMTVASEVNNAVPSITVSGTSANVPTGNIVTIVITDQAGGTVTANTTINPDGSYTAPAIDVSTLTDGPLEITASATDIGGNPVGAEDDNELILDAIDGSLDINATANDEDSQLDIDGTTNDVPAGNVVDIVITDQNGNSVTTSAIVNPDGSYDVSGVDVSGLTDGTLTIVGTSTDNNGNPVSDQTEVTLDAEVGNLTVDGEFAGDAIVDITGTTNDVAPGTNVVITITDQAGNTLIFNATVGDDGTYSVSGIDVAGLTDGTLDIFAEATDNNGNPVSDTDVLDLDATVGALTVDGEFGDDANLVDITGTTTDVAAGSNVAITITDINGVIITTSATVGDDGTYSVDGVDVSSLADGTLEILAESVDNNGNPVSDTDTLLLDLIESALTVAATIENEESSLDITGGSIEVPAGNIVNLTITDVNGFTIITSAVVDAAGNYSVSDVDVTGLEDGILTIDAVSTDVNGDPVNASTTVVMDRFVEEPTPGTLTVDGVLDDVNELLDITGTTTEVGTGAPITLIITDQFGTSISVGTLSNANGTYSVSDVNVSALAEGVLTISAAVTDDNGFALTANDSVVFDRIDTPPPPEEPQAPTLNVTAGSALTEGEAAAGTTVATSAANDPDGDNSLLVFSFTPGSNADGFYAINSATGQVTLTQAGADQVNGGGSLPVINVTVTDEDGLTASDTAAVTINDGTEEPEEPAAPTLEVTAGAALTEGEAAAGTTVATSVANDPDGDNSLLVFSFTPGSNADGYYAIDSATGQVTLTQAGADQVNGGGTLPVVNVTVTDEDGLTASDTATVTVNEAPVEPEAPTLEVTAGAALTEGEAAAGNVVATSVANDPDGDNSLLVFSFTPGSNVDGYYAIDPATGEVTLTEAGADHVNGGGALPVINVTVTDEDGLTASDTANIIINEAPVEPEAPTLEVTAGAALTEGEAAAGNVVATSVANDPDGDNSLLVFSFTPGSNVDGYYEIDSATGEITLTEAGADHVNGGGALPVINVTVTDEDGLTASDTAVVTVNDAPVEPEAPTIEVTAGAALTEGEAAAGNVVATSVANDPDGDNSLLVFSFTPGSNDDGFYAIDPTTGEVTLTAAGADHVNGGGALPVINVTVTDEDGLTASDTAAVTVNEAPVEPEAPTIEVTAGAALTEGEATASNVVATSVANDPDGDNSLLVFSFTLGSNDDGYYAIDSATGEVTLTEAGADHVNGGGALPVINVTVTDEDGLTASDTATVTVNEAPVEPEAPTLEVTAGAALTEGEAAAGNVVATSVANDPDGDNSLLVFSFTPGSNEDGYYSIDSVTGEVTLTQAGADHVNGGGSLPVINVTVTDEDSLTASDTAVVTVNEAPVEPEAPTLEVTAGAALTEGEAAAGATVATSVANDPDGDNSLLVFSFTPGSNDDGYYAIDSATGEVTLTEAGADHVNGGGSLPVINVTVTDEDGLTASDTTTVTVNEAPVEPEAPTLEVTAGEALTEGEATAGNVVATSVANDPDGDNSLLVFSFTPGSNDDGYYAIDPATGEVTLTEAGADHVNGGGALPVINVTVTDEDGLTASDTAAVTVNEAPVEPEAPTIEVTAGAALTEGEATASNVVATSVANDPDGDNSLLVFSFTPGSNDDGYYAIDSATGEVTLTEAGADHVNNGGTLPVINVTVTDEDGLTASDTANIIINDAPAPTLINLQAGGDEVYEAGLSGGTQEGSGATEIHGQLTATGFGTLTVSVNGTEVVTLDGQSGTTGDYNTPNGTLTIRGDGSWTYSLESSQAHNAPNDVSLDKNLVVTVSNDWATSSPVTLDVTIVDDVVTADPQNLVAALESATFTGELNMLGADGDFSADLSGNVGAGNWSTTGYTAGGETVYYYVDAGNPTVLIAYTSESAGAWTGGAGQQMVFELSVDAASGSYTLINHFTGTESTETSVGSTRYGGGNKDFVWFHENNGFKLTGSNSAGDRPANTFFQVSSPDGTINWSGSGVGVNNNWLDAGETMVFTFTDGSWGDVVTQFDFLISGTSGSPTVNWTAYGEDGVTVVKSGSTTTSTLDTGDIPEGASRIEITTSGGGVKLSAGSVSFTTTTVVDTDVDPMNVSVTLEDADGDTITESIGINLVDTNVLTGTSGSDAFFGGDGADTFAWQFGDQGSAAEPTVDTVANFNAGEGDVLDLSQLLQGESDGSIMNYLSMNFDGGNTTISVSHTDGGPVTQQIVVTGVDLTDGGATAISDLLTNGTIKIDS